MSGIWAIGGGSTSDVNGSESHVTSLIAPNPYLPQDEAVAILATGRTNRDRHVMLLLLEEIR